MRSILVANRGEIACRIIRTCRNLGIRAVALASPSDRDALHARTADAVVALPGDAPREGYANLEAVIAAARAARVDGIYPGYGFLSENAPFARAVEAAGLVWIGPNPATIADMGEKSRAKDLACRAGLPILPGSPVIVEADAPSVAAHGAQIGYPLLVKAVAGGGGMGMKRVDDPSGLAQAVASVQAHAGRLFANPAVFLEKLVSRARHVEIQVFGFGNGEAIHLYERECSIQRRYQKVLEESPAPNIPAGVLAEMAAAAVALARQERYSGPGTVEFLYDDDTARFYFLEMNTRIQVEHPVTEMITGCDLVEMQISLAFGDLSSVAGLARPERRGHAIEVRLYAEDPARNFLPNPGRLSHLSLPSPAPDVRIETGVSAGDVISPFYDPMIAKIICWGETRAHAIARLRSAIGEISVCGVKTNRVLLSDILSTSDFLDGDISTDFLSSMLTSSGPPR